MKSYLGIDIGGSAVKFGWGNSHDGLQYFSSVPIKKKSLSEFKLLIEKVLQEVETRVGFGKINGIGIGSPGTIDVKSGKVVGVNPNLPFWVDHDPRELIPANLELPILVDNDANLMALAEAHYQKAKTALGITVGSGIGSGIIIDGKIYHGASGYAGELGHVIVVDSGVKCNCGRLGCLEAYASVDGLRNRLVDESPHYTDMQLSQILAIKAVDGLVAGHIAFGQKMLCGAIANAIVALEPEAVIFGGGGMDVGLYSIVDIKREIEELLPEVNRAKVQIKHAMHGNKAGVIGAIMMLEQA